jgi:hypothetical protein
MASSHDKVRKGLIFASIDYSEIVGMLEPFIGFPCIDVKFVTDGSGEETELLTPSSSGNGSARGGRHG